jgi:hypothetical protein
MNKTSFSKHILNYKSKIIFGFFFILLMASYVRIFAIGSPYQPGATLDPACTPGEVNCIVSYDLTFFKQDGNSFVGTATLGTNDANPLVLETNNTERARILSNGNFLVGTSTDGGYKLDINGNQRITGKLALKYTTADAGTGTVIINSDYTTGTNVPLQDSSILIGATISNSGNSGYSVSINGTDFGGINSYFNTIIGYGSATTADINGVVLIGKGTTSSAGNAVVIGREAAVTSFGGVAVGYNTTVSNTGVFAVGNSAKATASGAGSLGAGTVSQANTFSYGGASTLHGFGTTTPTFKLEVSGGQSSFTASTYYTAVNTGWSGSFASSQAIGNYGVRIGVDSAAGIIQTVQSTSPVSLKIEPFGGNTLIGTAGSKVSIGNTGQPQTTLHIESGSADTPQFAIQGSAGSLSEAFVIGHSEAGTTTSFLGNTYNNDTARFDIRMKGVTSSNAVMTIYGSGSVLIGTTTDAGYKLDVNGTGRFTSLTSSSLTSGYIPRVSTGGLLVNGTLRDDGTNIAAALSTGSVSIGETTPTSGTLLQVNTPTTAGVGTITVTASSGAVTGAGTTFTKTFFIGDTITANSETHTITAIASDTSMTTDAWTSSASGVAYTLVGGNRLRVDQNGRIIFGGTPISVAGNRYIQLNPLSVNAGFNILANLQLRVSQTGSATSNGQYGVGSVIQVQANNTQNYTGTLGNGLVGINSNIQGLSGAGGTATNVTAFNSTISLSTFSATNTYFFSGASLTVAAGGTITNAAGVAIPSLSAATNSTSILMGTTTIPAGTWGLYNATIYNNYLGSANTIVGSSSTTDAGYRLQVGDNTVAGIVARFTNSTGTCDINPTTTALSCSSDKTLKKNITPLDTNILDRVLSLNPVTYNWNSEADSASVHNGFIAQEVEQIFPDLVSTDSHTGLKSLNYMGLIPYTVKALQQVNLKVSMLPDVTDATLMEKISSFLEGITNGIADIGKVKTQELCVDDICVTRDQFKTMVENATNQSQGSVSNPPAQEEPVVEEPGDNTLENPPVEVPQQNTEETPAEVPAETPPAEIGN